MTKITAIETRSVDLETRNENDADMAGAIAAVAELRTAVETRQAASDDRLSTGLRGLTERLDAIDVRTQRPGAGGGTDETPVEVRAFTAFIRGGDGRMMPDEVRALTVSNDTAGGYLAPAQFEAEIIRELVEISPIRAAARVTNTSAGSLILPKRTGRLTANWVGETENRPETEPVYGQTEIPVNEIGCYVDVSNRLLNDAAVDIEAELTIDFAEEFARLEGEAFIRGNGVKKPVGVMNDATVPFVLNGHATDLKAAALIRLMYSLPAFYRNRGSWLLNGSTIGLARLFIDTTGRFLWQESLQDGQPATLLGRPVIEATEMEDPAANTFPIAFGDFESAYRIVDRVGMTVIRDPLTQAVKGLTRFHAGRRVGAGVVRPDAIRKLKMATA